MRVAWRPNSHDLFPTRFAVKRSTSDVVIIGAGMGGSTTALTLAPTGASILILEQGAQIRTEPLNRDTRAIFQKGAYTPQEKWFDTAGRPHAAGTHANFGGSTKFYGALLARFRETDFDARALPGGDVPAWPIRYADVEPWYEKAEALFRVCGNACEDPTEPWRKKGLPNPPVPDEPPIAALRERFRKAGLHPYSLPLGVDIRTWLSNGQTGWDGYPDARSGKMDAETCALLPALAYSNVKIQGGSQVVRLVPTPDRRRIQGVVYRRNGELHEMSAKWVVLAGGTVKSAALLLASEDGELANGSGRVGRHLMGHNQTAVIGFDHRFLNDSIYQKTFGLNDFYLPGGAGGEAMGNVQLLGRVNGEIMKGNVPGVPAFILDLLCRRTVDFFLLGEDLPDPASRVLVRDGRVVLDRKRTNMEVHRKFIERFKGVLREIGFKRALHRTFDEFAIGHQCGTLRMGHSAADSVVDPLGRSHDVENLFVVDGSVFVSSAAVNPALTIAALSLRTADNIARTELAH